MPCYGLGVLAVLLALAALTALCLVGYRIESSRETARVDLAPPALSLRVVGEAPWVRLGDSVEASIAEASAEPLIVSSGFTLVDDQGRSYSVPAGSPVQIRAVDGARRAPIEGITSQGALRPRLSFDVPPDAVLYSAARPDHPPNAGYRGPPSLLAEPGSDLVLSGSAALTQGSGSAFPGCWLLILVPTVGSGVVGALLGSTTWAWASFGVGTALALVGLVALPAKPRSPEAK